MQPYRPSIIEYRLAGHARTPDGTRVTKSTPGATAVRTRSPTWWGKWRRGGRWLLRPTPLSRKLATARQLLAELVRGVELGTAGIDGGQGGQRTRPLAEHLDDYRGHLEALARCPAHIRKTVSQARAVCMGCAFAAPADLDAGAVALFLAGRRRGGISVETSNHYLQAVQQFGKWLAKRTHLDPLAGLKALNAAVDRRRTRRPLSRAELPRLLRATGQGPPRLGLSGPQRRLLYHTALRTGLRAGELASLTPRSLDLGPRPTVTVLAAYSKHRRQDVLPLRQDLAAELALYCQGRDEGAPLWQGPWALGPAALLRPDLAAAGIPVRDGRGRVVDFHALRHTAITHWVEAGIPPKMVQLLARHSTITLTMDRYVHFEVLDAADDLNKMSSVMGTASALAVQ